MTPSRTNALESQARRFAARYRGDVTNPTSKSVAIVQSCYIPWKGYFDLVNSVDEFILYDDQQYTRRDWRNRNRIKTAQGTVWLSIPVKVKGKYRQRIDETEVADPMWAERHWRTLVHGYSRAPYFDLYGNYLHSLYEDCREALLSKINRRFLDAMCDLLGIRTRLTWSTDYEAEATRSARLVSLCRAAGATSYLSGPAARAYLDESLFEQGGIEVRYMDYSGYPEYEQLHPPFEHAVSIIDLLVHTGPQSSRYLKSFCASLGGRDAA
jgi:WbqC-like protein